MNCLNTEEKIRLSNISKESWCQATMPQIFSLLFLYFPSSFLSSFTTSFHHFNCHSLSSLCLIFPPFFSLSSILLSDCCFAIFSHMLSSVGTVWPRTNEKNLNTFPICVCLCPTLNIHTNNSESIFSSHAEIYWLTDLFFRCYAFVCLQLHLLCHTEQLPV